MGVVPDGFVEVLQLEGFVATLGHLTDDPGRLARDDAEAGYDHIRGDNGSVEYAYVILDDGKLADDDVGTDMHVAPDSGGLDDGSLADEDLIA